LQRSGASRSLQRLKKCYSGLALAARLTSERAGPIARTTVMDASSCMTRLPATFRKYTAAGPNPLGLFAAVIGLLLLDPLPRAHADALVVECATFRVREQDQVWLVSTRHLGCSMVFQPNFQVWRYSQGWWQPSSEAEFFATDSPDIVTPIYVHGNRIDASLAGEFGLQVYFQLVGKLDHEPPTRLVIWSWPADQIKGPLNDVRSKAARSDYDAFYLANFLGRMQPNVRVGIVGYSLGARIASGAMHLIGGGALFGHTVAASPGRPFRVAMWAASEHSHWYLSNQFHSQALDAAEAWYVTVNPCDPILARYRFIDCCGDPSAVGYAGLYGRNLLPAEINARIEEVNVSNIVGDEHHWRPYLYSRYIQDRTRDYVLWHPLATSAAAESAAEAVAK
jgi:hypothetical protein